MINNKKIQIRLPERLFDSWRNRVPHKLSSKVLRLFMRRALDIMRKHPETVVWFVSGEYEIRPIKGKK